VEKYAVKPGAEPRESVFPYVSNQEMNRSLKLIGEICDIKCNLTFHSARHLLPAESTPGHGLSGNRHSSCHFKQIRRSGTNLGNLTRKMSDYRIRIVNAQRDSLFISSSNWSRKYMAVGLQLIVYDPNGHSDL